MTTSDRPVPPGIDLTRPNIARGHDHHALGGAALPAMMRHLAVGGVARKPYPRAR